MYSLSTFSAIARRFSCVLGLLVFSCILANAYTVVMRDGRHLEIPAQFVVTATTVTYEVSPGLQITLNMRAIDVAATERINNEPPGSFMRRGDIPAVSAQTSNASAQPRTASARKTITNRELEPSMNRRRASEAAYEKHRQELGLPSVEESRRRSDADLTALTNDLSASRAAEQASEASWRERAFALRSDIAAVDAELQYVRAQIDQPTFPYATNAFPAAVSVSTYGGYGGYSGYGGLGGYGRRGGYPAARHQPVYAAPNAGGRVAFGGRITQGQFFGNPFANRFPGSFNGGVLPVGVSPFLGWDQPYDYSYERSVMINRFNELSAKRLALNARWRELEDEARRAGVPPGWLRK
jgi:hypothetical protein